MVPIKQALKQTRVRARLPSLVQSGADTFVIIHRFAHPSPPSIGLTTVTNSGMMGVGYKMRLGS